MLEDLDWPSIADDRARALVRRRLNVLEEVRADLRAAQAENQRLRDEINRLQGEQGRPQVQSNTPPPPPKDHASEQARRRPNAWSKGRNTDGLRIDGAPVVAVDPARVPPDAEGKGDADVVVQDSIFRTDQVLFQKEKLYSPSPHHTSLAALPPGYHGQCGPGLKSLAWALYGGAQMSAPQVAERWRHVGVHIADGQMSHLLLNDQAAFPAATDALSQAGLGSSPWPPLDDTRTRVKGQHGSGHLVGNPLDTADFTTAAKDRLTMIDGLTTHRPRRLLVNAAALGGVEAWGRSAVRRWQLGPLPCERSLEEATRQALLEEPRPGVGPPPRQGILEATAAAASHADVECPVVRLWVCDDAPPGALVTEALALCWGPEGRHDQQRRPSVPHHRPLVEAVVPRFWAYDDQRLASREPPTPEEAVRLDGAFETWCSTVTGDDALDERMAKTRANKAGLLMGLTHPEIALHNNPAELGARARVRTRDVSFGPRTREGAKAWDPCMTLAATAMQLGVSFYHDLHDRVSGAYQMPALADLIPERAQALNRGASWNTS